MALNGRSKPLVRWIIRPAAGAGLGIDPMGIVVTHGADAAAAYLIAALRWRMSQRQLVAMKWDECDPMTRYAAASAERSDATRLVDECRTAVLEMAAEGASRGSAYAEAILSEQRGRR